jgi:hypothetical protein
VTAVTKGGLFAKKPLLLPRDDVSNADFNGDRTTGARILFRCIGSGNALHNERFASPKLDASTAHRSVHVERHMFVSLRTIAPGH